MDRALPEESPGVGIAPMSLAGTCSGHVIERGPKRGTKPRFCSYTCGAFVEGQGTLKPAAVRLPPGMEWGCVNWRARGVGNVPHASEGVHPVDFGGLNVQQHTGGVMCGGEQRVKA